MNKKIVNIVDFVRRETNSPYDMIKPVVEEIKINKEYNLPSTILLHYNCIIDETYTSLFLKEDCDLIEYGIWLELSKTLVEKCGFDWRGSEEWEWHVVPGYLEAYTQEQRKVLIDEIFNEFKKVFGYYPKVVGNWIFDAFSMNYMCEKYGIDAFCNCREQYGVDAYTLWGGYYNGGYYPSKNNALCPAQNQKNKIDAPCFRMLGSDPIYNYLDDYSKEDYTPNLWPVHSLEPGWDCGRIESCVDWYFRTYFEMPYVSYQHLTTGQENGFGWEVYGKGYLMQMKKIAEYRDAGLLTVEKLGETGRNFKKAYKETPPTVLLANEDWAGCNTLSAWYNSINYRSNSFLLNNRLYFRDIRKYDDKYQERYLEKPCETWSGKYDCLPIMDMRKWRNGEDGQNRSECYFVNKVDSIKFDSEGEELTVIIKYSDGKIGSILYKKDKIVIYGNSDVNYILHGAEAQISLNGNSLEFIYENYKYKMTVNAKIEKFERGYVFKPIDNKIEFCLNG